MNIVIPEPSPIFVETGVVIGKQGEVLLWHEPENASGGALPDSRQLWEFFRDNWPKIWGFAHTHPDGYSRPSWTDITTFAAIEAALDLRFTWWIVTQKLTEVMWVGKDIHSYSSVTVDDELEWVESLRRRSVKFQQEKYHG